MTWSRLPCPPHGIHCLPRGHCLQTCKSSYGVPANITQAPLSRTVVGRPFAAASKGHVIIQCGPILHELVHGNGVTEEAHRRAGVHAFCACGEGVIPRPILWWCQNGASHRKNFDTPPLLGSCKCTTVHLERFQRHNNFRCTWVHLGIRGGYGNFERQEKRAL